MTKFLTTDPQLGGNEYYNAILRDIGMRNMSSEEIFNSEEIIVEIEPSNFTVDFTITDSLLIYKLFLDETIVHNFSIHLEDITTHNRFFAQTIWAAEDLKSVVGSNPTRINQNNLHSLLEYTFPTKRPKLVTPSDPFTYLPFYVFFPSEQSTFSDCSIRVWGDNSNQITFKVNGVITQLEEITSWKDIMSTVTLTANNTNAGGYVNVSVTASDTSLEYVILEQETGSLDREKVILTNGQGTFNILANTFSSGETLVVHAGFKKFTKAATLSITLE